MTLNNVSDVQKFQIMKRFLWKDQINITWKPSIVIVYLTLGMNHLHNEMKVNMGVGPITRRVVRNSSITLIG